MNTQTELRRSPRLAAKAIIQNGVIECRRSARLAAKSHIDCSEEEDRYDKRSEDCHDEHSEDLSDTRSDITVDNIPTVKPQRCPVGLAEDLHNVVGPVIRFRNVINALKHSGASDLTAIRNTIKTRLHHLNPHWTDGNLEWALTTIAGF